MADRNREDLEERLAEQVEYMRADCRGHDQGNSGMAKRLSGVLRTLFHDTSSSHSLIGQLGLLPGLSMFNTSTPVNQVSGEFANSGLTFTSSTGYVPRLNGMFPRHRKTPFSDWWNEDVLRDGDGQLFSRRSLVLAVANKDYVHIDPTLPAQYSGLTRDNSMEFRMVRGSQVVDFPAPVNASLRQIAHETLVTFAEALDVRLEASDLAREYVSTLRPIHELFPSPGGLTADLAGDGGKGLVIENPGEPTVFIGRELGLGDAPWLTDTAVREEHGRSDRVE